MGKIYLKDLLRMTNEVEETLNCNNCSLEIDKSGRQDDNYEFSNTPFCSKSCEDEYNE